MNFNIEKVGNLKVFRSPEINWNFNTKTGFTAIWGKTKKEDPIFSPFPLILDIEITTKCSGIGSQGPCKFCYKSNTAKGENMSLETFKKVLDKMPFLTQLALGVDAKGTSNPEMFKMMEYTRSQGIIPNLTIADISDDVADNISRLAGACAVSRYEKKEYCYNSVKKLIDRGLKQTNIHVLVSEETFTQILETFKDYLGGDERLKNLNAIVLLNLKKKGRGTNFNRLSDDKFNFLVMFALMNNIPIGFDSCGAVRFLNSVKNLSNYEELKQMSEPCESGRMSSYVNVEGKYFPCSFTEGSHSDWMDGFYVPKCNNFVNDIWNHPLNIKFRNNAIKCIDCGEGCQVFDV